MFKREKLLVLIPIHNYVEGVNRLVNFANNNLNNLFTNWKVVLINNNSGPTETNKLKELGKDNILYIEQNVPKNLKINFQKGLEHGKKYLNPTIVAIWETDAIPNLQTFKALVQTYIEERGNGAVSTSPMYKWCGQYCYPTHPHWHTDPIYKKHPKYGDITHVHAVPFVFSIWDPKSLERVNSKGTEDHCEFLQLCRDFGVMLSDEGKYHLRLKSYHIDHFNGGKISRNRR